MKLAKFKFHYLYAILIALILFILAAIIIANLKYSLTDKQRNNICYIFKKYPNWYKYSKASEKRWGTPVWTQLAIINQESKFKADARSQPKKIFGIPVPFTHKSSAYGYSQALNSSWQNYSDFIDNKSTKRSNFKDSTDFIAWYIYRARKYLHLNNSQIKDLYLAYHEGINGYRKKNYRKNKITIRAAYKVSKIANKYQSQFKTCRI